MVYISGDSITSEISTLQFFPTEYFNKYIRYFTSRNRLLNCSEQLNLLKTEPLIIITKIEYLDDLYKSILCSLDKKFVLITHYGAKTAVKHRDILNHPFLIKWYGQNMSIISNKTMSIPLGLENSYWKRTNTVAIQKYSANAKSKLLYLNFSLRTNSQRVLIMNSLLNKGFSKNEQLSWNEYIEDLSMYKFCISPEGMGRDCRRMWECLYLGVIPIVQKSTEMSQFTDLPILFVDNYDVISKKYLEKKYNEIKSREFNLEKLSINYWRSEIWGYFDKHARESNAKIHVISYGNGRFQNSKKRLLQEARSTGWFDTVTVYGPEDLDTTFEKKYSYILKLKRGGGYWIWKSHIIQKMLDKIDDSDILIYLDAGCTINKGGGKRFYEYMNMLEDSKEGILSFQLPYVEKHWTTNQIFDYFYATDKIKNSGQLLGGIRIMKKCPNLLKMIKLESKALHDDPWMFTDRYNKKQQSYFKENRHDQSIFSIIRKLHNPILIPNETWAPGHRFATKKVFEYPFWATRKRI